MVLLFAAGRRSAHSGRSGDARRVPRPWGARSSQDDLEDPSDKPAVGPARGESEGIALGRSSIGRVKLRERCLRRCRCVVTLSPRRSPSSWRRPVTEKHLGPREKITLRYVEVTNEDLGREYLGAMENARHRYAGLKDARRAETDAHGDPLEAIKGLFDDLVARLQRFRFDHIRGAYRATDSAAMRGLFNSPRTNSRLSSNATRKKKNVIRPSLSHSRSERPNCNEPS
jgi:hypothetical protein